jgi:Domain of unknown function (4846)
MIKERPMIGFHSLRTAFAILATCLLIRTADAATAYPWHEQSVVPTETLSARIAPPQGFERVPQPAGSFGAWLRGLPLKPAGTAVLLHTGQVKPNQSAHVAVIDIDTGVRDLQQCADAIMRLRAEWLYGMGRAQTIAFNDTDGKRMVFRGNPDDRKSFSKFMTRVFAFAGTYSLAKELKSKKLTDLAVGDVFIKGGFPGHAVLVVDVAIHPDKIEKRFLLAQSYMPAQDMHILKNPAATDNSPWYALGDEQELVTPEWTFAADSLRSWP